jgi:hypothetical protein
MSGRLTVEERSTLLEALKADDDAAFKCNVLEALSSLLLMCHWLRGIVTWATWVKAIEYTGKKYSVEQERANYDRLNHNLELYEEQLWKFLPPRAILQQFRLLREQGYLDPDFEKLLQADSMGHYDRDNPDVVKVIDRGNEVDGRGDIPLR